MKSNQDIRDYLKARRIKLYEVSDRIGISEVTLIRWMRTPLTAEHRHRVIKAIRQITAEIEEMRTIVI